MDPATDTYYYWLCTISIPVFYNLMLLVARCDAVACLELLSYCSGSRLFIVSVSVLVSS